MIGAIIGDIVGSKYEFNNIKTKDFKFFDYDCIFTDDTVMTIAVAKSLLESKEKDYLDLKDILINNMKLLGRNNPDAGYGGRFESWLIGESKEPYNSFGNGSAMRVSPCGDIATSLEEAKALARITASVTHNHPEGIKGAEATAACIYLAKQGKSKDEIRNYINDNYYKLDFTLDDIRPTYEFDVTCQGSVPQAIECFLESNSFIDSIRNAISIGGDSDTIGAITGGISEAYYGIDEDIIEDALSYLPTEFKTIIKRFYKRYKDN